MFFSFFSLLLCFRRKSTRKFEPKITYIFFVLRALRNGTFKMLLEIYFGKNSPVLFATVGMRRQLIHGERQKSVQKRINQLRFASHAFKEGEVVLFLFYCCEGLNSGVIS